MRLAYIPSPTHTALDLGPIPVRYYALCIIVGIIAAVIIGTRRYKARGGQSTAVVDIAVWAVLFGLVGARAYHVATDPELYFAEGRHPLDALKIWDGGLGIWGAVALGALGAWIGARRAGIRFAPFADAVAPGILVAQAIGRVGNWFNNELFGRPTDQPWGLTVYNIDPDTHQAKLDALGNPEVRGHFQPTFLYELVWNLLGAVLVVLADKKFKLGRGRVFALYAMVYTAGRVWVETLRDDPANEFFGLRLNIYTCAIVFVAALVFFVLRRGPREENIMLAGPDTPAADPTSGPDDTDDDTDQATVASSASTESEDTEPAGADGEAATPVTDETDRRVPSPAGAEEG